jgi:hypothetical protein
MGAVPITMYRFRSPEEIAKANAKYKLPARLPKKFRKILKQIAVQKMPRSDMREISKKRFDKMYASDKSEVTWRDKHVGSVMIKYRDKYYLWNDDTKQAYEMLPEQTMRSLVHELRESNYALEAQKMRKRILKALEGGSHAELGDLNDWAVNTVREYAREMKYDANALAKEEARRIKKGNLDLDAYRKVKRTGSKFRLKRSVRTAMWTIVKTREAIQKAGYK